MGWLMPTFCEVAFVDEARDDMGILKVAERRSQR